MYCEVPDVCEIDICIGLNQTAVMMFSDCSQMSFQINHINQLLSVFIHSMVVIIYKKIFNNVRLYKSAFFIETKYRRTIARSNI